MHRHSMLGRDHEQKGAIAQVDLPGCALVLISGLTSPAPKKHPNEDAVGVVQTDGVPPDAIGLHQLVGRAVPVDDEVG